MARRKRGKFDSRFEQHIWDDAKERGLGGIIYHPRAFDYATKVRGGVCGDCGSGGVVKKRHYTPDFKLGRGGVYLEAKGKFTPTNRNDMSQFIEQHRGSIEIRFLFMRDNWLTGAHKHRYSDWATDQGCVWAVGNTIPQEWVEELSLDS